MVTCIFPRFKSCACIDFEFLVIVRLTIEPPGLNEKA